MANPTSLVAKPILDDLIKTTFDWIKKAYSSTPVKLEEDVENLKSKLTVMKAELKDAENKQVNNLQPKDWLGKLKEAVFDAEDALDTYNLWKQRQISAVRNSLPSLGKASPRYDIAHMIKDISKRFDIIAEEKKKIHRPETPNYTGFLVDKPDIVVGREDDKKRIRDMMLSNELDKEGDVSVIPIIGMRGLGKTTLAQLVFNDESVIDHFDSRMWVSVTVEFDLTRILKEMIQSHSEMKLDDSSKGHLQSRLLEFTRGKRFLLVLDDVCSKDISKWESLRGLLKEGAKGSRVLVTSQDTSVGEVIGTQPSYPLECLREHESWSLFAKIAFWNVGTTLSSKTRKDLEDIGSEIVRKCKGLPLAVKAMGGLLRCHTDVSKWQQIQSSEIWEIEDENPGADKLKTYVMAPLKLSYDHLPAYLKPCFEYCSLFPKSHVFCREDLVKLWIAQGFIQSSEHDTMEGMEEAGNAYFSELVIRSFFQHSTIGNKEIFNMHDLIHEFAQSISSSNGCFSKQSRHVSFLDKHVEPMLEIVNNATKLRTLLLPNGHLSQVQIDKVFHTLKFMRVLDLSSTQISKLPDSIKELELLRYLDLSRTEIRLLPNSICNLIYLQTLKLLGCLWLSGLPKDLGNLVHLRHLELDDMFWFKLPMLPPSMGNLTNLQNLPVFQVGREKGYGIEQLEKMSNLSGTLHISKLERAVNAGDAKLNEKKSLDKLVFEWSDRVNVREYTKTVHKLLPCGFSSVVNTQDEATENRVLEDLQPPSNLKELQIIRYMGNEFPAWMKEGWLQNLIILTLNGCIKCKTLNLGLPNLRELYIKGMQELEKWTEVEYHYLRRLKLSNCPKLRDLPRILPILRVLKIKSCNSLSYLPVTPFLQFLVLIDNLILEDWNEVTLELEDLNGHPSFIELLELKVISCPKLQALPLIFPQKLEIQGCELLTTLPPPPLAQCLKHLALDGCHDGALVRAIPKTRSLYSLVVSSISNISSLPKWPQLPGLKALYIRDCKDLVSLSDGEEGSLRTLTSLNLLSIRNCQMLEALNEELSNSLECLSIVSCPLLKSIGPKEILKNLPSLKDLYIEDCPILQSLPVDGLPSSLQHLQIQACPLLTDRIQKEGGGGSNWPKIEEIPDLEIDNSHIVVPSTSVPNRPVWYRQCFLCCRDFNKAQSKEVFLEHKSKKKWADEKTGHFCFMLYARSLYITWANRQFWIWNCFKETSDENIEVAKLSHVCWLDVRGKLDLSELSPEVVYEIVYVVKLTKGASGWELPILLKLSLPDGRVQERQVSLLEKPRRQWIELNLGNFQTKNGESGEVGFEICEHGGHWKGGLIIKGAVIRPKQTAL